MNKDIEKKRITASVPSDFHKDVKVALAKRGLTFGDTMIVFYNKFLDLNYNHTQLDMEDSVFNYLSETIK